VDGAMPDRNDQRSSEAAKLAVIWTCAVINATSAYLLVFTKASRVLITLLFCSGFVLYFLYVRYRTPPV
jgi:hypothetical protein